jgi:hypothetical protein
MPRKRTIAVTAAVVIAGGSAAVLALIPPAGAATADCANARTPVSGPIGCGAVFLPGLGGGKNGYALTLTAPVNQFGAPVTVQPYDGSTAQDWTVYSVCVIVYGGSSEARPCGIGALRRHRYVLEYTPGGRQPPGGLGSDQDLCLNDDAGHAVLGTCIASSTFYRTAYYEGFPDLPDPGGNSAGVPPTVMNPSPAEIWSLQYVTGGVELLNMHSGRVLDDTAFGGPGTALETYAANGGANQVWRFVGCSNPFPELGSAWYGCVG